MNPTLQIICLVMLGLVAMVSLAWVAMDAKARGRNPVTIVLLCLLTWPLGFFFWRGIRPPSPIRLS
jgi:hypothetical protein